jgi:hypothetical protein
MKHLLIPLLVLLSACSTYIKTPATKMISPESEGGVFFQHGSLEGRLQSTALYRPDFTGDRVTNPLNASAAASEFAILADP